MWVLRFCVLSTVTSHCGKQFESHLWKSLSTLLGIKHLHTTSYYPIARGLVERLHRQLKAVLKVSPHPDRWDDMLLLTLLSIRSFFKGDLHCTDTELVYSTSLHLPGEFFTSQNATDMDPAKYVVQLMHTMRALCYTPLRQPRQLRGHVEHS